MWKSEVEICLQELSIERRRNSNTINKVTEKGKIIDFIITRGRDNEMNLHVFASALYASFTRFNAAAVGVAIVIMVMGRKQKILQGWKNESSPNPNFSESSKHPRTTARLLQASRRQHNTQQLVR